MQQIQQSDTRDITGTQLLLLVSGNGLLQRASRSLPTNPSEIQEDIAMSGTAAGPMQPQNILSNSDVEDAQAFGQWHC